MRLTFSRKHILFCLEPSLRVAGGSRATGTVLVQKRSLRRRRTLAYSADELQERVEYVQTLTRRQDSLSTQSPSAWLWQGRGRHRVMSLLRLTLEGGEELGRH